MNNGPRTPRRIAINRGSLRKTAPVDGPRTQVKRQPGSWPTNPMYASRRWRKTRLAVLTRDRHRCWVADCYRVANICDHIDPVTPSTTLAAFHDIGRLRASCREHNLARGILREDSAALGMTPRPLAGLTSGRAPNVLGTVGTIRRDYSAKP